MYRINIKMNAYKKEILPAAIKKTIELATDKLTSTPRDILLFLPSPPPSNAIEEGFKFEFHLLYG